MRSCARPATSTGSRTRPDLHLTGGEAGAAASRAGVGRLLLTHLVNAWGSEAQTLKAAGAGYAGPIAVVARGTGARHLSLHRRPA